MKHHTRADDPSPQATPLLRVRVSTHMDTSPENVYELIVRRQETPSWNSLIRSSVRTSGADGEANAQYREIGQIGPMRVDYLTTVLAAVRPSRLEMSSESSKVSLHWGFDIEPEGDGALVTMWSDVVGLRGLARIMRPLMAAKMPRGASDNLASLRSLLEARGGSASLSSVQDVSVC